MEKEIKTRFAPSPTGYLHVGGARTALFNWLYARHNKGKFVLRIEDTDAVRSTAESTDAIFEALKWMGIDWDEGPYFQSKRGDIYKDYLKKLIDNGNAYYCNCSPEKIEEMRKKGMAEGGKPKYDGTCREKGLKPSSKTVIRFKAPLTGVTIVQDKVKGSISFQNSELDDFIIARTDGLPTYNFAVVIDDMTMGINTVIRGDDHVMNTPKQILLYKALKSNIPIFCHVPMVLGPDKARLSKRHGAMSVTAYRDMGFLPEAFINYLARLGWSFGDQEFFTVKELIEKFTIKNIGKAAGIFDIKRLRSLNFEHIRACPIEKIAAILSGFLKEFNVKDDNYLIRVIQTLIPRSETIADMAEQARFYFVDDVEYDVAAAKKFLTPETKATVKMLIKELEALDSFDEKSLEGAFKNTMEKSGLKLGKIAQPVRVCLTGKTASPGIFEIISILGRDKTLKRLRKGVV